MKLAPRTFRAFWDLHSWAGVVSSLVVYVLFFFALFALFHPQLQAWQEPGSAKATLEDADRAVDVGVLTGQLPRASLTVYVPSEHRDSLSIGYSDAAGRWHSPRITPGGRLAEPRSDVAGFLYAMHYLWFDSQQWLYIVAGVASALLALVLVTGTVIHVRDIVRHFHRFRPEKRMRVAWSDAHKVLGTIGLPFALLFALTGAWLGLSPLLQPRIAEHAFGGDSKAAEVALWGAYAETLAKPANQPGTRVSLRDLLARGQRERPAMSPHAIDLRYIGDRDALAVVRGKDRASLFGYTEVALRQRDGSLVSAAAPDDKPPLADITRVAYGFHFASYGGMSIRWAYALLTLAACFTILTGNWLWLARRRPSRATYVLQRLTVAVGAGSVIAAAAMLLANRILPDDLADRVRLEMYVFAAAWLAATGWAFVTRDGRAAWARLVFVGGILLAVTPIVGTFTVGEGLWAWPDGFDARRAVDVALAGIGCVLVGVGLRLARGAAPLGSLAGSAGDPHAI